MRIFRCVAVIIVSAILVTGCKKDVAVAPVKANGMTIRTTVADGVDPNGGQTNPQNPPH